MVLGSSVTQWWEATEPVSLISRDSAASIQFTTNTQLQLRSASLQWDGVCAKVMQMLHSVK